MVRAGLDRIGVDRARSDRAAGPLGDQARRAIGADACQARLLALLEAQARLGPKRIAEGRAPDADRIEDRGLNHDLRGGLVDLGARPAHDAGDADRPVRVGDDERLGVELAVDMVERLDPLAGGRAADDDPAVVDGGGVEGVGRLAELEHDVVGGVHDVADRALAGRQQAHLDPVGRWTDVDAADPATDEPWAQAGVEHLDAEALRDRPARLRHIGRRQSERRAGQRGHLAGKPDHRQRVAPVRLDVDVEDRVAEQLGQRTSERRVGRQDQDAVGVRGQAELVARAEHPVADDAHLLGTLDPPVARQDRAGQGDRHALAGRDVGRAADDLERLAAVDRDAGQ